MYAKTKGRRGSTVSDLKKFGTINKSGKVSSSGEK